MKFTIKRIDEPATAKDGFRVLVDRLWPRGVSKEKARIDIWLRESGPSTELRQWLNHDPAKWKTFCTRHRAELRDKPDLLALLTKQAQRGSVTLLYSAQDERFNQAAALLTFLQVGSEKKHAPGETKP